MLARKTCILLSFIHGPPVFSILGCGDKYTVQNKLQGSMDVAATNTWGRGARITLSDSPCQEGGQGCKGGSVCEAVTAVGMSTNRRDSLPVRVDCKGATGRYLRIELGGKQLEDAKHKGSP